MGQDRVRGQEQAARGGVSQAWRASRAPQPSSHLSLYVVPKTLELLPCPVGTHSPRTSFTFSPGALGEGPLGSWAVQGQGRGGGGIPLVSMPAPSQVQGASLDAESTGSGRNATVGRNPLLPSPGCTGSRGRVGHGGGTKANLPSSTEAQPSLCVAGSSRPRAQGPGCRTQKCQRTGHRDADSFPPTHCPLPFPFSTPTQALGETTDSLQLAGGPGTFGCLWTPDLVFCSSCVILAESLRGNNSIFMESQSAHVLMTQGPPATITVHTSPHSVLTTTLQDATSVSI